MQLVRRPLAPGETDYEFTWLLVCLGSLVFGITWFALKLPLPICVFHSLTGRPCATCGATRSAIALFHGHFLSALGWNPLAFLTYCVVIIFNLYAIAMVVARGPRLRLARITSAEVKFLRAGAIVLLMGNWIYLLISR
jgi:Protein of unknown function (DUF2752)